MSTLTTIPEWTEDSPVCTYALVNWDEEENQKQYAALTLSEYDSLKQHLAGLRETTKKRPKGARPDTKELVKLCEQLLSENCGNFITPFNEFLDNLLTAQSARPLTPDDVTSYLQEFESGFEDMRAAAASCSRLYPALLSGTDDQTANTQEAQ